MIWGLPWEFVLLVGWLCISLGVLILWTERRRNKRAILDRHIEVVMDKWYENTDVCPTCKGQGRIYREAQHEPESLA